MLLWMAALAGCDAAPIYGDGESAKAIGTIPPRSGWTATGTVQNAANAVDGNINTIAVAAQGSAGAQVTIDLGKPGLLNMMAVDHGRNEFGYARQLAVSTSLDGQRFTRRYTAGGTRRVSTYLLLTPILCRYIRLEVLVPGDQPWSVAEVYVQ